MRIDKFLSEAGVASRSEIKKIIKNGRVAVDGLTVNQGAVQIDEFKNCVTLDGEVISYEPYRYYILNKPAGCVSATKDRISSTVMDMLAGENVTEMFPVGRLDKDTEGLLLITNDGMLAHNLLSPRKHVDKTYIARVSRALTEEELLAFAQGVDIGDDSITLPANIRSADMNTGSNALYDGTCAAVYEVTIREGRYHQIKRMFRHFDSEVLYLKRISMGILELDDNLEPGAYRKLNAQEMCWIREHGGAGGEQ